MRKVNRTRDSILTSKWQKKLGEGSPLVPDGRRIGKTNKEVF